MFRSASYNRPQKNAYITQKNAYITFENHDFAVFLARFGIKMVYLDMLIYILTYTHLGKARSGYCRSVQLFPKST